VQASARILAPPNRLLRSFRFEAKDVTTKKPGIRPGVFVVDPSRENWQTIFSDLQILCARLEQLDIEVIMEADDV